MEHTFTANIKEILAKHFGKNSEDIFKHSHLIQYLNRKTKSASKGSKARGSFANIYAIYVLVEDYITNGFHEKGDYSAYEGAIYNKLFQRQRELPFGTNLQNHALNNRLNSEFENLFPTLDFTPINRIAESERYWFNQNLLRIKIGKTEFDIASAVIKIIDEYVKTKMQSFERFLLSCQELQHLKPEKHKEVEGFILSQLAPNVDARLFEIISYSILKYFYHDQKIYWGYELKLETLKEENLSLYKTGRTNANDGGIDFVMKPIGRFFQVTETLDFKKYFLDIHKLEKYPITFVIKANESSEVLIKKIEENALKIYSAKAIVTKFMSCVEEIINIPTLTERFNSAVKQGYLNKILDEIVIQSKVEFNYEDTDDDEE
ncbi:MAG: restriction endonuclease [Bacteroidetes bacterium]|nr:restriction endonuclease [Bacteroidota bacterium]